MKFERIWVEQHKATKRIKRRFGAGDALHYLVGEKLVAYARHAERDPKFARELPKFLTAIWQTFNPYELAGYIATLESPRRKLLRGLLFVK
ncbi:MAG TPA: hypothetical protein VI756_12535 [Blastocatellia bacterium]